MAYEIKNVIDDYKIQILASNEKPLVFEFLNKFFFPDEPLNAARNCASTRVLPTVTPEQFPVDYFSEELSLKAVTFSGELIGIILNAEVKFDDTKVDETKNSDVDTEPEDSKLIGKLLDHVEEQINLKHSEEKEMEVRIVTVHEDWRNKGIGRKLLEQSRNMALQNGFKQIRSICTSAYTAKMFVNCGFQCIYTKAYEECKKEGTLVLIPREPHTHVKGMILKC